MSVTKLPLGCRLQVRWNTGLNENMEPVFRIRSWSNVKPTATPEALHQLGNYINDLCVHVADSIRVEETYQLQV